MSKPPKSHKELMDAIVKDIFSNGGPMRPANGGYVIRQKPACHPPKKRKEKPCPALLGEQKRLIKTWNKKG